MSSLRSFFKDTVLYGMASVLPRVINFALVAILTDVFGTSDFSIQTRWYVYAAFINVVLTLGIETSFFRFFTKEQNKDSVISTSFILLTISSIVFLVIGAATTGFTTRFFDFSSASFIHILIWTTVLDTLVVIPFAYLRVTKRPLKFMFLKMMNVVFLFLTTIALLVILPKIANAQGYIVQFLGVPSDFKAEVIYIMVANLAASAFTFCIVLPDILKIKWSFDKQISKKLLTYGLPIMIGGLAYVVNENMDKLIITSLINESANGVYSACYKLGVFMTLYITAFRMGAEPFFFNQSDKADAKQKYSTIMTWFVIFGCICIITVVGFIDVFASLFLKKEEYLVGLIIVPIILIANLFSGIYNNLSIWYKLTDKTTFGMYISIFGAILTIVLLCIFVPAFGIIGGAFATLATYVTMTLISWYIGHKYYPVPYEYSKILGYIFMSVFITFVSFHYFRGSYGINGLLCFCFGSLVFFIEKIKPSDFKNSF